MRRCGIAAAGGLLLNVMLAIPAFAGSEVTPPQPPQGIVVVRAPGGTAFTGSNITMWMVLAVALLVVGLGLLIASRRRARTTTR
jgi:LPXTG-motif cell wall-anchored protein